MLSLFKFKGSWVDFIVEVVEVPVSEFEPSKLVIDETKEGGSIQSV